MSIKRRAIIVSLLALLCVASEVHAQPVVVYTGPHTIAAAPYWQALANNRTPTRKHDTAVPGPRPGVQPLADALPLQPVHLHPGAPVTQTVDGLMTPFFVMGMDSLS